MQHKRGFTHTRILNIELSVSRIMSGGGFPPMTTMGMAPISPG